MRVASCLVVAVAACGGGTAPPLHPPGPPAPVEGPLVAAPPAPDAVDAGAAPALDEDEPSVVVAAPVSWPSDRGPAQLHFLGGGTATSTAKAVSSDGSTPVGFAKLQSGYGRAVRWRDGQLTPLAQPASVAEEHGMALATSRNGDVVVGLATPSDGRTRTALVWQSDGSGAVLAMPDGLNGAEARSVSRDGAIIAGCAGDCGRLGRWTGGTWAPVTAPDGFRIGAHGMSEDGTTLAGTIIEGGDSSEGARLGKRTERLGLGSRVLGISDDGTVVVGSRGGRAAMWRGAKHTDLGLLGGYEECHAVAVSSDGGRVVGTCMREHDDRAPDAARMSVGFIWDKKRGIRSVHEALTKEHGVALPDGAWLTEANDICGYGLTVVGSARTATSAEEAWMAIVPR